MKNGMHKMPNGHMMKDSEMGMKGEKKGYGKKSGGRKGKK